MGFQTDDQLVLDVGEAFGQYITTFISDNAQVHVDIFENEDFIEAHVSFSGGLDANSVTDKYVSTIFEYARTNGYAERLKLIYHS